ncbi:hypothetical protein E9993_11600 [Labilibacter sediminis]|nr:hypothetical protein E9993_11600 [Labilibacter sediminis]
MKKLTLIGILITGFITHGFGSELLTDKIKFASIEKANELLTQEDDFTKSWSQFDIDSRMHKKNSTREELFDFITKQTREWTVEEQNKILSIFKGIDKQIEQQGFKINFPNEIYFVKTTANEEGGAGGYTRASYIVLKDDILSQAKEGLKKTIIHELFHILTRNSPEFRKEMYQIIGFKLMNEVAYPEKLKDYRITNPDAPQVDSYISIKAEGQRKDCMMILYSNQDYNGGDFFKYLNVGFLSLKGDSVKTIEYIGDKPVIYTFKQVTGFFEQIGRNTQYIIHPEEILADNFAFAILNKSGLQNPEIVNEIKKKLKE